MRHIAKEGDSAFDKIRICIEFERPNTTKKNDMSHREFWVSQRLGVTLVTHLNGIIGIFRCYA